MSDCASQRERERERLASHTLGQNPQECAPSKHVWSGHCGCVGEPEFLCAVVFVVCGECGRRISAPSPIPAHSDRLWILLGLLLPLHIPYPRLCAWHGAEPGTETASLPGSFGVGRVCVGVCCVCRGVRGANRRFSSNSNSPACSSVCFSRSLLSLSVHNSEPSCAGVCEWK